MFERCQKHRAFKILKRDKINNKLQNRTKHKDQKDPIMF